MLRATGRKNLELEIRMCNSAEREIDHSVLSASADAIAKTLALRASERRAHANRAKSKRFSGIGEKN